MIFSFFSNLAALAAAGYFIEGFSISFGLEEFLMATAIFTAINFFLLPFLKLVFSPLIFITFGIGIILINAAGLYILDFFSDSISIAGILPLLYSTLVIGLVNFIIGFSAKRAFKE